MSKLVAENLCCVRNQHVLFSQLSFQLDASQLLIIEGANGSGKSSLLRLLTGLSLPDAGEITWQGSSIYHSLYTNQLHYLGHRNGLKLKLTVLENLQLASLLANENFSTSQLDAVLQQLQLINFKHRLVGELSAGQQRRVALAKLFLIPKTLWILDEPLTALDAETQKLFFQQLEKHSQLGGISVLSTHQPISLTIPIKNLRLTAC